MTVIPPLSRRSGLVLVAAATLVAAACGPGPSPTPRPTAFDGRLLVHTGRPEVNQLFGIDGRGDEIEIAVPEGGLRFFAAALDGRLAGIRGDGTILVASATGADWRPAAMDEVPPDATTSDIRLPAWSPDGRLAILFGDAGSATTAGVLIVDPATDGGLWIGLEAGLGGYPPAWLDVELLAVPTRDAATDDPTMSIVAVDTGIVDQVVPDARVLAASPDGSTLAIVTGSGAVELRRPADWRAGTDEPPLERFEPAGSGVVDAVALDRTGDRLAIGTMAADGGAPGDVRVLDGTAGWSVVLERAMAAGAPVGALAFVP